MVMEQNDDIILSFYSLLLHVFSSILPKKNKRNRALNPISPIVLSILCHYPDFMEGI